LNVRSTIIKCAVGALVFIVAVALRKTPADAASQPDVAPPPGLTVVREVQGGGAQVYSCKADASGAFKWLLYGPNAILINDDGTTFGSHTPGPTWTAADGSSISADGAHPLAQVDRTGAVPSLLLKVTSARGSGILSGVQVVGRSDTKGGLAPSTGCDAAHANATIAEHYSAIYTFYR